MRRKKITAKYRKAVAKKKLRKVIITYTQPVIAMMIIMATICVGGWLYSEVVAGEQAYELEVIPIDTIEKPVTASVEVDSIANTTHPTLCVTAATNEELVNGGWITEESLRIYPDENLDGCLQQYMKEKAEANDIPFEILLAIAKKESNYNPKAKSNTGDHGLMQINEGNFDWLAEKGITDYYDPYQSIDASVAILNDIRECYNIYQDWHAILMCYNMGYSAASEHWENGTTSSYYSRTVMGYAANFN